jgi:branched-subunit amino acid aminotransferase/4-amino-4-deoxychorismate lyase
VPSDSEMPGKFGRYQPHFTRPSTAAEAAQNVLDVFERGSVEKGSSGTFVSHFGNKQWL